MLYQRDMKMITGYPIPRKFRPIFREKYKGNIDNIIARSSWETRFFKYLDHNSKVLKWSSEETVVAYISPLDNRHHRYFLDAWVRYEDDNGIIKEKIIEIKPFIQTQRPVKKSRITKKYRKEVETYVVNIAKWKSAKKYADKRGMEFQILTENELFKKKS